MNITDKVDELMRLSFLLASAVMVCNSVPSFAFERIESGDTVVTACERVTFYERATAFSSPGPQSKFGDQLVVRGLDQLFELPSTDYSSKEFLEKREIEDAEREERRPKPIPPERYTRAAWFQFDQGYAPASCFVTEDLFKSQTEEEVQSRVDALASGDAKRNFSEDEGGDMTAMRGAAGRAQGGPADFEAVDTLIRQAQSVLTLDQLSEFRAQGGLGEFQ
jgi:hypothetical protein